MVAASEAVKSVFTFLSTTEGQATIKSSRESTQAWEANIAKAGTWIENLLKGLNVKP